MTTLSYTGPFATDDGKNRSSIDCFIAVLRRLFDEVDKDSIAKDHLNPEDKNILQFALTTRDEDEHGRKRDNYLQQLIILPNKIIEPSDGTHKVPPNSSG